MKIETFITEQPAVVKALSDRGAEAFASALPERRPERVVLIGTGSSMNALIAAFDAFAGFPGEIALRSPLTFLAETATRRRVPTLAIVLSQTGKSSDTIAATDRALEEGMAVIVVTAGEKTALTERPVTHVALPVADETVGPKTKGYTASVHVLWLLGTALSGSDSRQPEPGFYEAYERLIAGAERWSNDIAPAIADSDAICVLGQGRHFGSALEASLKVAEMAGIPSFGLETEEASHGRLHGLTPRSTTFLLAGDRGQAEFAGRIRAAMAHYGLKAHILDAGAEHSDLADVDLPWPTGGQALGLDALAAVVPFQWLGVHLARERGLVPEDMPYPGMTARLGIKVDPAEA